MTDRQKCAGKSKQTGKPCGQWAIPGGTVCRWHGGAAPQVAAAAKRRLEAAEAVDDLARMGVSIATTPIEALEAMLYEAAGNVVVLRGMAAELEKPLAVDRLGEDRFKLKAHPIVLLYNQERDRLAALAGACAKLGLDQRRVELAEAQVSRFFDATNRALVAAGLSADQVATFKRSLAADLRGA